ncbi:MAG: PAS domain S-box protein [Deltaproteobacteria bacterium]
MGDTIPFPAKSRETGNPPSGDVANVAARRIARICALGLGLDELLGEVCREIKILCGAEGCHIVSCREATGRVEVWRSPPTEEWPDPDSAYRSTGAPGRVLDALRSEAVIAVGDLGLLPPDDPIRAMYDSLPVRSVLLFPLKFATRLLGFLSIYKHSAPGEWREGDVRLIGEILSPIVSAALERRGMEERLRDSEARYRFLADHALDFISLHDPAGKILYASPAARRMLGYRPEEMMGVRAEAFIHPDDSGKFLEGNRRLAQDDKAAVTLQYRLRRKDGGYMEVETVSSPVLDERGEIRQVLRVARDLSERKKMEARLFESQKLETIGLLAGGVAHEFNNLLVGISGAAEMLSLLLAGNAEAEKFLAMVERNGERAVELTGQLLAYARQGKYSPRIISLNQAVSEDVPILKATLPAAVEVRLDLKEEAPPVLADLTQLKQVVMSLCLNAGEAMPEGGVLAVRTWKAQHLSEGLEEVAAAAGGTATVIVRSGKPLSGPCAILEVSDSGIGMDRETLSRIFEPFFSTKFIGRGMGLAAVRGIVETHDGEILVMSEPGKGSTFIVGFPAASGPQHVVEKADAPHLRRNGTVLVADDEDDVREVVGAMLRSLGYGVIEARDGIDALEIFRMRRGEIDLVLLDLKMPGMTGDRAFAEMRRMDPTVRGLLASGYDESGRIRELMAEGFGGFLQKPFRRDELGRKVEEALADGGRGGGREP